MAEAADARHPVGADGVVAEGGLVPRFGSPLRRRPPLPLTTALEREIDTRRRFTLWPSGDAHWQSWLIRQRSNILWPPTPGSRGTRAARCVAGATPLAEGSVRHSAECVFTRSSLPDQGSLPNQISLREGHPKRRRMTATDQPILLRLAPLPKRRGPVRLPAREAGVAGPGHPQRRWPRHRDQASATTQRPPAGFRRRSMETAATSR